MENIQKILLDELYCKYAKRYSVEVTVTNQLNFNAFLYLFRNSTYYFTGWDEFLTFYL